MSRFAKHALLFCLISSLQFITAGKAQGRLVFPEVSYKRLLNDLQITAAGTPSMGEEMTIGVVIRYGSAFDPADKGGLANLVSRMLSQATSDRTAKDIQDELAYLTATLEVTCDWDGIRLILRGRSGNFERSLLLLYQVVGEAQFREQDFARIKSDLLKELNEPEDPRQHNRLQFERLLFRNTTYGRNARGSKPSIQNIQIGDVRLFYRRFFSPGSAALVVAGSAPIQLVLQKATRIWGVWVRKEDVPATFLPAKPPAARQIFLEDNPSSPAAQFVLGNLWPRREDPRFYPAGITARILQARLTKSLPTSLVTVGAEGRRLEGAFFIQGQAAADQAFQEMQKVVEVAEALKEEQVPPEEIAAAQGQWLDEFSEKLGNTVGVCQILLDAELYRLGTNYVASLPDLIHRCNSEAVREAAREWLFPGGLFMLVHGPATTLKSGLESLGTVELVRP